MVDKIVKDIREALKHDLYFAALNSALTLPDICGKAAYPDEKGKNSYIKWYDDYIGKYEKSPLDDEQSEMPYLSGAVMYALRCSMLHSGEPNINGDSVKNKPAIEHFSLVFQKANRFDLYGDSSCVSECVGKVREHSYQINVRRICMILCNVAEMFYHDNKDCFHFNYSIINWDDMIANSQPLDLGAFFNVLNKPKTEKEKP